MGDQPVELSEEMLEAIRILRSDKRSADFEQLRTSHQELIARLDRESEERTNAQKKEEPTDPQKVSGTEGGNPPNPILPPDAPLPPPKVIPPIEPPTKTRKAWHERDTYKHD